MKLTDENQDYMDSRPPRSDSPVKTSEEIQKLIDQRKEERRQQKILAEQVNAREATEE